MNKIIAEVNTHWGKCSSEFSDYQESIDNMVNRYISFTDK